MQGINLSYTVELDPDISNHRVGFELQPEHIRPIGGETAAVAITSFLCRDKDVAGGPAYGGQAGPALSPPQQNQLKPKPYNCNTVLLANQFILLMPAITMKSVEKYNTCQILLNRSWSGLNKQ